MTMDINLMRGVLSSIVIRNLIFRVMIPMIHQRQRLICMKAKDIEDSKSISEYISYGYVGKRELLKLLELHYQEDLKFQSLLLGMGFNGVMQDGLKLEVSHFTLFDLLMAAVKRNQVELFKVLIGFGEKHGIPISRGDLRRVTAGNVNIEMMDLLIQYQQSMTIGEITSNYEWSSFNHNDTSVQNVIKYGMRQGWAIRIPQFNTTIESMKWICESGIYIRSLRSAFIYEASIGRIEGLEYLSNHRLLKQEIREMKLDSFFGLEVVKVEALQYIMNLYTRMNCTPELLQKVFRTSDHRLIHYVLDHLPLFKARLEHESYNPSFIWPLESFMSSIPVDLLRKLSALGGYSQLLLMYTIQSGELDLFKEFCQLYIEKMDYEQIKRVHLCIVEFVAVEFARYLISNYTESVPNVIMLKYWSDAVEETFSLDRYMELNYLYQPYWDCSEGSLVKAIQRAAMYSPLPLLQLLVNQLNPMGIHQTQIQIALRSDSTIPSDMFKYINETFNINYGSPQHLLPCVHENFESCQYVWNKYNVDRNPILVRLHQNQNLEFVRYLWNRYYPTHGHQWVDMSYLSLCNVDIISQVLELTPGLRFGIYTSKMVSNNSDQPISKIKQFQSKLVPEERKELLEAVYENKITQYKVDAIKYSNELWELIEIFPEPHLHTFNDLIKIHSQTLRYGHTKIHSYYQPKLFDFILNQK